MTAATEAAAAPRSRFPERPSRAGDDLATPQGVADALSRELRWLADVWPLVRDMVGVLESVEQPADSTGQPELDVIPGVQANESAIDVKTSTFRLVRDWVQLLMARTAFVAGLGFGTAVLLRMIGHPNPALWLAEHEGIEALNRARRLSDQTYALINPDGTRWRDLRYPCPFPTTNGEPCVGTLEMLTRTGIDSVPALQCTTIRGCPTPHCEHMQHGERVHPYVYCTSEESYRHACPEPQPHHVVSAETLGRLMEHATPYEVATRIASREWLTPKEIAAIEAGCTAPTTGHLTREASLACPYHKQKTETEEQQGVAA